MSKKDKYMPSERRAPRPFYDKSGELVGHIDPRRDYLWTPVAPSQPAAGSK